MPSDFNWPPGFRWPLGTNVRKIKGAEWNGRIVGFYSSSLTPEGYVVESTREVGSVQVYPAAALARRSGGKSFKDDPK